MFYQFFCAYKNSFKFSMAMCLVCSTICKQSSAMDSHEINNQLSNEQHKAFVDILSACDEKDYQTIQTELERHRQHVDVVLNHVDYFNWTCLKIAVFRGDPKIVELLHQHGALLHLEDNSGMNVVQIAASNDKLTEMLCYFLTIDPLNIHIKDFMENSLLDYAKKNCALRNFVLLQNILDKNDLVKTTA